MKKTAKTLEVKKSVRPYVIVRCRNAGVHAGEYVSHKGTEVVLVNARRIWLWRGANELNGLAVYGASRPAECRFGPPVKRNTLLDACEIIVCQPAGEKMIRECAEWRS